MKHLFLLLPICCNGLFLAAQPCYSTFRNDGLDQMKRKNYGEAISQFVAALVSCKDVPADNDLGRNIQEAKETWVRELQLSAERERKAYLDIVNAKNAAEKAQSEEKLARQEAISNAQVAYARGVNAESLRLALLADMLRERGQKSDACMLAWMSLQMAGVNSYGTRAFYEAVRDSFSETLFNSSGRVESFQFLPGGKRMLVKNTDHTYFVIGTGDKPGIVQLPGNLAGVIPANTHDTLLIWEGGSSKARIIGPDGALIAVLEGHVDAIRDAVFSPDDSKVVTCSRDKTARTWDLKGTQLHVLQGHNAPVQDVGLLDPFSGDFFTRSSDGKVIVWSGEGIILGRPGVADSLFVHEVVSSSRQLVLLAADGRGGLFNTDGSLVRAFSSPEKPVKEVQASPSEFALRTDTGVRRLTARGDVAIGNPSRSRIQGIQLDDPNVLLWTDDHVLYAMPLTESGGRSYTGHQGDIISAFEQGAGVLSTSRDGTAKLWNGPGEVLCEWPLGTSTPAPALFSPDGNYVVVNSNGGKSITRTPLAMDVYRALDREKVIQTADFSRIVKTYNIQFAEVLERPAGQK